MPEPISPADVERFYRAALVGLGALDLAAGKAHRFGPGADARWKGFQGQLVTADRIDLLCRDAAVKWEAAFSPARVFALGGLAPDDPFGPAWPDLDEHLSARLWSAAAAPASKRDALQAAAQALGVTDHPLEGSLSALVPTSRIAVGGLFALSKTAEAFLDRPDLRWTEQVVVIADHPAERQLAGLIAAILQATGPTRILAPARAPASSDFNVRLLSAEASPEVARAVRGTR